MRSRVDAPRGLACAIGVAVVAVSSAARADQPRRVDTGPKADRDTTYGRFEGDLGLVVGAGLTVAPHAPRATLDLRVRYLDTAGIFLTYEDAPLIGADSDPRRVFSVGAELRPFFILRWARGLELARDRLDLLVDSIGLELGASFAQPNEGAFASRRGLQAGLGIELPILARATGPWIGLHGGVRWSDQAISGDSAQTPADRGAFLSITLAWHQIVLVHAVDVGDRAPR